MAVTNPQRFNDLVENAAFIDATGRGVMGTTSLAGFGNISSPAVKSPTDTVTTTNGMIMSRAEAEMLGMQIEEEVSVRGRGVEPMARSDFSVATPFGMLSSEANTTPNALTQAVKDIAAGNPSVNVNNVSITGVDSRGNTNVDIDGDGRADRRVTTDPVTGKTKSYNFNIDRSNDRGGRGGPSSSRGTDAANVDSGRGGMGPVGSGPSDGDDNGGGQAGADAAGDASGTSPFAKGGAVEQTKRVLKSSRKKK